MSVYSSPVEERKIIVPVIAGLMLRSVYVSRSGNATFDLASIKTALYVKPHSMAPGCSVITIAEEHVALTLGGT